MPNTNVPNINVPKWLWRGGVRPNWDNVLKSGFFFILKASLTDNLFLLGLLPDKNLSRENKSRTRYARQTGLPSKISNDVMLIKRF